MAERRHGQCRLDGATREDTMKRYLKEYLVDVSGEMLVNADSHEDAEQQVLDFLTVFPNWRCDPEVCANETEGVTR